MKKTLILLLAIVTAATCFAQKIAIRLNLKKDSTYYIDQKSTIIVTQDIPGHKQVIATTLNGIAAHKVTGITDSSYVMAVQFESLVLQSRIGDNLLYDVSTDDKTKQDIMSKVMRSMMHQPITMIINKAGKVLEINGVDNLFSHVFDSFPEIDEDKKEPLLARVKQSFGEKSFRSSFQDAFAVFPQGLVGINDSWSAINIMESVIQAKINTIYTLKAITDNTYEIQGNAQVASTGSTDYATVGGMPARYLNLKGSFSAEITLDKSTCWLKSQKITKTIKGDLDIKDNPKIPGGMKFPMSVEATVILTDK